jgi:hypothetical protein
MYIERGFIMAKLGRRRKINDLELAYLIGCGLTAKEMAEKLSCSVPTVNNGIKHLRATQPELLEERSLEEFRKGETDELANLRRILVSSMRRKLTTTSLSAVSLQQLGVLYGIIFEKDRLLRGEATEHIATQTYNQLDSKTRNVIANTVKELTSKMITDAKEKRDNAD